MKKIYMLAIALVAFTFVNAQNYDWNMSDEDFNSLGSLIETTTVNGLTIYAASGKNVDFDDKGPKTLDEVDYTYLSSFTRLLIVIE